MFFTSKQLKKKWHQTNAEAYGEAYEKFGGSVITHPRILIFISDLADVELEFRVCFHEGRSVAVVPVWGDYIAGSKKYLKKMGKNDIFDLGNPEVILPFDASVRLAMPFRVEFLSQLHKDQIKNKRRMKDNLCLARPHQGADALSTKFKYNRRREWRILQQAGAGKIPVNDHDPSEISDIYCKLFYKRWGWLPKAHQNIQSIIESLKNILHGDVIYMGNDPIAIQMIYMVESVNHISAEYVNGGVDPDYSQYSPGSVLSFLNTQSAFEISEKLNKPLRYSFGKSDEDYKDRWSRRQIVCRV